MAVDALKTLRDLIAIPSVNPMRPCPGEAVERGVADYIESVLRRAGVDCERQAVFEGRENVVGIVHPSGGAARGGGLMLNSHMDTVPVANMAIDPFDPVVRDGRVYGRGACDAKGPIAAMLAAVTAYAERRERPATVVFAAMADEEFAFSGAWKLVEREWPVSACVVGEPTRLSLVVAHKGVARWRVRVKGRSAHGATPQLGRSAIYDGARVLLALEAHARELAGRAPHSLLGAPSLNVGRVAGGQSVNVVPDLCEFEMERRLLPGEDGRAAVGECEASVRAAVGGGAELEFEEPYLVDPALDTPETAAVARAVCRAHLEEFGADCEVGGAHYGTDGSKLAGAGIETVVCGPGDVAQAHTKDEYVEVEQLERAARLYARVIEGWPRAA
ncbi:MAG TPA: M20 family metallopeptidase [Pyrinomonadaceae bacterium]|jgi:acetylornithine deacetylase|nr:M20 family metallopeptidase [Pyrinomonadaceae bacterium]